MRIPLDYKELLKSLNRHKVRYLIVGAYAVMYYTEPRYSKDIDIWIEPVIENARKVCAALKEFGAPLKGIGEEDFTKKGMVYQMGVAPVRVDIIMGIGDLEFAAVWKYRVKASFEDVRVNIIGRGQLIKAKEKAGRPSDLLDIKMLKKGADNAF
ncbi:MAG: hypothetical protein QMD94_03435 [Candidatus Omnitrophota bacterium]|nr:hypothetical protein [Candidatus Omnitrophota bacterium]